MKIFNASSSQEIDAAFADLAREHADALYVGGDTFLHSRRDPDHFPGSTKVCQQPIRNANGSRPAA